jgi:uncharacterized protein with PIN domain
MDEPEIRFLVDVHLRRLARWLRSAGLDAAWEPEADHRALYRRSWVEKRTILTMKRSLWAPRLLQIESHDVRDQFRQVVEAYGIDPYARAFTRCVVCNVPVVPVEKASVEAEVPPKAFAFAESFHRCPDCRRVFWRGTHTERTLRFFEEATGIPRGDRFSSTDRT